MTVPTISSTIQLGATQRVIVGIPAAEAIAAEAERLDARHVFILASGYLLNQTDEVRQIQAALGSRHAATYAGIGQHVPLGDVLAAAHAARGAQADLIVTVGGGSVIDAGKLLALCLRHDVTVVAQFAAFRTKIDENGNAIAPDYEWADIPIVAVPTTLSGGEFSALAGATDISAQLKSIYEHREMASVCVILDPSITKHTPEWLWLSTGVRAIDHAVETLASFQSNYFCDGIAESALHLLIDGLPRVKADPDDLDARVRCQIGAWQSMIPIIAGVPMGGSHAIGHVLGGTCKVAHGHTSCVMAPHVLEWNYAVNSERQKRISAAFGAEDIPASKLVDAFIRKLGMPHTLSEVGITADQLQLIADNTLKDIWAATNPRPLRRSEDVVAILEEALE